MSAGPARPSWATVGWLARQGGSVDLVRIALTAVGAALATLALLAAATVQAIGPGDGPYSSELLQQPGLHVGVVTALVLLCLPILALAGQCARIGAPARDRRLAAIRMAGATPAETVRVAVTEAGLASALGALLGTALFFLGRIALGGPIAGTVVQTTITETAGGTQIVEESRAGLVLRLPTDVLPAWWVVALLTVAAPVATALLTALALRQVAISPFGVSRRTTRQPPRLLPAVLFLAGVAGLSVSSVARRALEDRPDGASLFVLIFLGLLLLTIAGLLTGTATLASLSGRLVATRTRHPGLLIAGRRLVADPYAASRTFGVLLATVLVGAGAQAFRANLLVSTDPAETFYRDVMGLVDLVLLFAVVIASLGLLVAAGEGVVGRRRTLAALTAAGTPVGTLRRAVLAEALLPLLFTVPLAALAGVLAGRGLFGSTAVPPQSGVVGPGDLGPGEFVEPAAVAVPVPWAEVSVLVGGTLALAALAVLVSLVLLRASTDLVELRTAA